VRAPPCLSRPEREGPHQECEAAHGTDVVVNPVPGTAGESGCKRAPGRLGDERRARSRPPRWRAPCKWWFGLSQHGLSPRRCRWPLGARSSAWRAIAIYLSLHGSAPKDTFKLQLSGLTPIGVLAVAAAAGPPSWSIRAQMSGGCQAMPAIGFEKRLPHKPWSLSPVSLSVSLF
jgi:hypothetical protein